MFDTYVMLYDLWLKMDLYHKVELATIVAFSTIGISRFGWAIGYRFAQRRKA
jgi:hypothetical protein